MLRAWRMKVHRPHPASRTTHSACEIAARPKGIRAEPGSHRPHGGTARPRTAGRPPVAHCHAEPAHPHSRGYNSPRAGIPEAATLRNDLT